MADAIGGQGAIEAEESARLAQTARLSSASALSRTLVTAAQAAIAAVQGDAGGGAIGEVVADLRRLRTYQPLQEASRRDLDMAQRQAALFLADALWMGYRTGATGRAEAMSTARLEFHVALGPEDRAALTDYPVLGFTTTEAAASLRRALGEDLDRALAQPLTGTIDAAAIPGALAVVAQAHAERVAGAVAESYQAGIQAAVRALGAVLVGA